MRSSKAINVTVNFSYFDEVDGKVNVSQQQGTIVAPGIVMTSDGEEVMFFDYDRRQGRIVDVYNDNNRLFGFNYLTGGEQMYRQLAEFIRSGANLADFIRKGIELTCDHMKNKEAQ